MKVIQNVTHEGYAQLIKIDEQIFILNPTGEVVLIEPKDLIPEQDITNE